jgi:hypothetical protein
VDETTIRRAKRTDPDFAMEVARASTQFEVELVNRMRGQSERSWRAAAWLLERRLPEEFGRPPQREREEPEKPEKPKSRKDELLDALLEGM